MDVHRHGMIKGMIHWIAPVGRIKAVIDDVSSSAP